MRMSKVIGGVIVLLAFGSVVSTNAFKTASVTNNLPITVAITASAALGMGAPASTDNGITLSPAGANQMTITVNEPMQPGSTYCFSSAFNIKNATSYTVTLDTPTPTMPSGVTLTLFQTGGTACSQPLPTTLTSGGATSSTDVDLQFVLTSGATVGTDNTAKIVINAHR